MHKIFGLLLLVNLNSSFRQPHRNHQRVGIQKKISIAAAAVTLQETWWRDGLNFGCTGCGKCCQNDGDVWFDIDEFADLCKYLNLSPEDTIEKYGDFVKGSFIRMKSKKDLSAYGGDDSCIFLGEDGKKCTVYGARPVQCKTYPYWPRLLSNQSEWDNEAVVEDHLPGKKWSSTTGGCEGINHPDSPTASAATIYRNSELYRLYLDFYPFLTYKDDKSKFLGKLDMIQV